MVIFNGGFGEEYVKYDEQLYTKAFPGAKVAHNATQKISDQLQPRFANGTPPDVVDDSGKVYFLNYGYTAFGLWYDARRFRDRNWTPPKDLGRVQGATAR